MADLASTVIDFVASNPFAVTLLALLLIFVFGVYLFLRRTVKEFRRGMKGS
jgi:hypothetical protein